ncbi:hypothetical protein PPERSA_06521 [Pseudocohnilembus persalinus]|uniref:Uncharacterized protein n=1 Tax=Pseudocohnilembus persalinus TaxID=266149 RepID=A0A0V0QRY7_PSEPJ|nr:hypothetical protein PPERSA_06521 [Pseudocohnilembus persalinus]|eukprot:KRX04887.1 hypothetical protein PPERSA_06521 [Pseudocohnilembus persalinus]
MQQKAHKIITIFGSSSEKKGSQLYLDAEKLGYELCKQKFIIRSGGQCENQGIMSAVSLGAEKANKEFNTNHSIQGIVIFEKDWGGAVPQCTDIFRAENIGQRTEMLCKDSQAFIENFEDQGVNESVLDCFIFCNSSQEILDHLSQNPL